MIIRFIVFLGLVMGNWSAAATDKLLKPHPETVLRNEVVRFQPAASHHFSAEAPQKCGSGTMIDRGAREITCQFQKAGEAAVILNVCDDKKTFCKPIEFMVKVQTQVADEKVLAPKNPKAVEDIHKELVPGFAEGTPAEIMELAAKKKQPVFVMISTEWCPPCNETKEYLFTTPAFAKASEGWFMVYVDGDAMLAGDWEKVVPYDSFPTMVLLNSNFEEIGRFTKELRQKEFTDWAALQTKWLKTPITKLKKTVTARMNNGLFQTIRDSATAQNIKTEEDMRLLTWALDTDDKALVATIRKKASSAIPEDLQIRLMNFDFAQIDKELENVEKSSVQEKTLIEKKENLLSDLVAKTVEKDDFADYLDVLCSANVERCKKFAPLMEKRFATIAKWSGLTESEMAAALGEEGMIQSGIYEAMGNAKKAKEAASICAEKYELQVKLGKFKMPRSGNQALVHCYEMSGRTAQAEALVEKLIKAYPHEPTFLVRMAKLKKKQKKLDEAYVWIQKAEKLAYGYNWYSAILFKANLEMEMKNRKAALGTLSGALAQVNLPEEKDRRNHSLVQRIRSLQEKVQSTQ